jgi:hypothetical protein
METVGFISMFIVGGALLMGVIAAVATICESASRIDDLTTRVRELERVNERRRR